MHTEMGQLDTPSLLGPRFVQHETTRGFETVVALFQTPLTLDLSYTFTNLGELEHENVVLQRQGCTTIHWDSSPRHSDIVHCNSDRQRSMATS